MITATWITRNAKMIPRWFLYSCNSDPMTQLTRFSKDSGNTQIRVIQILSLSLYIYIYIHRERGRDIHHVRHDSCKRTLDIQAVPLACRVQSGSAPSPARSRGEAHALHHVREPRRGLSAVRSALGVSRPSPAEEESDTVLLPPNHLITGFHLDPGRS